MHRFTTVDNYKVDCRVKWREVASLKMLYAMPYIWTYIKLLLFQGFGLVFSSDELWLRTSFEDHVKCRLAFKNVLRKIKRANLFSTVIFAVLYTS